MHNRSKLAPAALLSFAPLALGQTEPIVSFPPPAGAIQGWGATIAALHDLDGDGVPELGVGASRHGGGTVASVHSGAHGGLLFELAAPFEALFAGHTLISVADTAGNGAPEVVVVGARSGAWNSHEGRITIHSSVDGSVLRTFLAPAGQSIQRGRVLAVDDLDGDGRDDVLCQIMLEGTGVTVLMAYSTGTGLPLYDAASAHDVRLVQTVFTLVDDHDGDGRRDVATVAWVGGEREIALLSGATGELLRVVPTALVPQMTGNGEPLLSVEDRDGDGLRDLAAGGVFVGFVEVFSSHDGTTLARWDCEAPGAPCFGSRLIESGDLDGDGTRDLIALETPFSGHSFAELFALSPARGELLFRQPLPVPAGGYTGADRIVDVPGLDPAGLPTFAMFDDPAGQVVLRRHAPDLGTRTCVSVPNSSGAAARMRVLGLDSLDANRLVLSVDGATPGQFGLFVHASAGAQTPFGTATVCVGSEGFGRLPVGATDDGGTMELRVDVPSTALMAGRTWWFQAVFRDPAPQGFQTSDAVAVMLRP